MLERVCNTRGLADVSLDLGPFGYPQIFKRGSAGLGPTDLALTHGVAAPAALSTETPIEPTC